jgi:hypothetical protein
MRLPLKALILVLLFTFLLPKSALAQNITALQVFAPSSVEKDHSFQVTAYYTSNGTNVCGATCGLSGGWLTSTLYLGEDSACIYNNTISAYGVVGSYSLSVNCYKPYYDSKTQYFNIEITRKPSSLSLSLSPSSPYPGDSVPLQAYYRDEYNSLIQGASCTADLKMGGIEYQKITLVPSGNVYYVGSFKIPSQYGIYDINIACDSSEYATASSTRSFTTTKKHATLSASIPSSGYYGQSVKVVAYYKDASEGKPIQGTCRAYFEGITSVLNSVDLGYEGFVTIPYKAGTTTLKITCESSEYETLEISPLISATSRPAVIKVISLYREAPFFGRTSFYPTDEIPLKISYEDQTTGGNIVGASCVAKAGGQTYPMTGVEKYYEVNIRNQPLGQQTIEFRCSKTFYGEAVNSLQIKIERIPITIVLKSQKTDFRSGEEIKIPASVMDNKNNPADAACRARADVYDPSFNRLLNSYDAGVTKTGTGLIEVNVTNPGEPSRIRLTVTCSGDILEEKSVFTDLKIKMLGEQTEEGIVLFLAATTAVLLALMFLIRRKLKII